jgi:hypothetical protein
MPSHFLGYVVQNEECMFQTKLDINPTTFDHAVTSIDTQSIAKENNIHGPGDKISLMNLVSAFNLEYRNAHTASNDAAYTIICPIRMTMSGKLPKVPGRSLQAVVNGLEQHSRSTRAMVGIPNYCTKCGSTNHRRPRCFRDIPYCDKCRKTGRVDAMKTHIMSLCTHRSALLGQGWEDVWATRRSRRRRHSRVRRRLTNLFTYMYTG